MRGPIPIEGGMVLWVNRQDTVCPDDFRGVPRIDNVDPWQNEINRIAVAKANLLNEIRGRGIRFSDAALSKLAIVDLTACPDGIRCTTPLLRPWTFVYFRGELARLEAAARTEKGKALFRELTIKVKAHLKECLACYGDVTRLDAAAHSTLIFFH